MKKILFSIYLFLYINISVFSQTYLAISPDGKIGFQLNAGEKITYMVTYNGSQVLFPQRKIHFVIRVYDDGIAFRYIIPESWKRILPNYENTEYLMLMDEGSIFNIHSGNTAWVADYEEYDTHQEGEFIPQKLSDVDPEALIGLPLLIRIHDHLFTAITEADLTDWAGMYLRVSESETNANLVSLVERGSTDGYGNN